MRLFGASRHSRGAPFTISAVFLFSTKLGIGCSCQLAGIHGLTHAELIDPPAYRWVPEPKHGGGRNGKRVRPGHRSGPIPFSWCPERVCNFRALARLNERVGTTVDGCGPGRVATWIARHHNGIRCSRETAV